MDNDTTILGLLTTKIGSADWNNWQIQRWQWYDYVRLVNTAASTQSLNFFSTPQGGADPVSATIKTLEQTNMVKSNTFGQQYFVVQQIRTHLNYLVRARQNATTAARTDYSLNQYTASVKYKQALLTGVLNMTIGQKQYFDINQPFRRAPAGFGVTAVVVPFDRTAEPLGNVHIQQSNNLSDVYSLTPPQLIEPEQLFQITIDFPDLGYDFHNVFVSAAQNANIEAGVILDGYLARPVQ